MLDRWYSWKMRMWIVAAAVALAACKKPEWKPRPGPGFVVTAPAEAELLHPNARGLDMTVYQYADGPSFSLQVQVAELPSDRVPTQVITNMRDHLAKVATRIVKESDVTVGDVRGKDFRYITDMPQLGEMFLRDRFLVQTRRIYQIMAIHRVGDAERDADTDRFVDSFAFTGSADGASGSGAPVVAP
jgi:hypothetical protein